MNEEFLNSEAGGQMKMRIPSRRFGTHEDLDGPQLLLASSAGAYMTGAEIVVDGGHLAVRCNRGLWRIIGLEVDRFR